MQSKKSTMNWRQLLVPLAFLLTLYVVVPQIGGFRNSVHLLTTAQAGPLGVAAALAVATYFAAAATYYWLAYKHLKYWPTLLVQVASMFANRILPAGIGALGANLAYLRKQKLSRSRSAATVALNNALGILGNGLLLVGMFAAFHSQIPPIRRINGSPHFWWLWPVVGLGVILLALMLSPWRYRIRQGLDAFFVQFLALREQPKYLGYALGSSMVLTICNVLSLFFCLLAVGGTASLITVLLVFSFGVSLGTATPTPGGLGGFEAGLVAGFIAFRVPHPEALAAALLYRLITYWLAIVAGAFAFAFAEQQKLFN